MTGSMSSHFTGITGGMLMSIISFSIVFIVCFGLMLLMIGLDRAARAIEKVAEQKEANDAQAVQTASFAGVAVAAPVEEDEREIIAVITAAITAAHGGSARIISVTPTQHETYVSQWRLTGIIQNGEGL